MRSYRTRGGIITAIFVVWSTVAAAGDGHARGWLARDFGGLGHDFRNLVTSTPSLATLGLGGGLALGLHHWDDRRLFGDSAGTDDFFKPGGTVGDGYVQVGGAVAAYSIGRLSGANRLGDVGRDLIRAQIMNATLTYAIKLPANRLRPNGSDHYSLPSGHTSSTFATATILARHFGPAAGIPAYLAAIYVGSSRIHARHHYLSDVALGAAVGIASGLSVEMANHRVALAPIAVPGAIGLGVTIALRL